MSSRSATSAYSPEAPSRSSWKQKLSLLKRREASQVVIDAATRDEEVVISPVARNFAESIEFDRIGSAHMAAQLEQKAVARTAKVSGPSSSSASSYHRQRVQTPVQRYANDSFEDMLSATGTIVMPADDLPSMTVAPGARVGIWPDDTIAAGKNAKNKKSKRSWWSRKTLRKSVASRVIFNNYNSHTTYKAIRNRPCSNPVVIKFHLSSHRCRHNFK